MKTLLSRVLIGAAVILGLGWTLNASALQSSFAAENTASPALKKVVIAYSGISPSQAPAWMAYEQGFFRKYGLDAQLIFVESGSRAVQTLISGEVIAAQVAGTSVIQSNLQGSGIVIIGGFLNTMDYKLIVSRDITRPDQLKGKNVAVSRIGSSSDFATRYALERYGLVPDKDVAIIQIGSQPARLSALETGKIHGVMIAIPLTAKATKMGFNALADLQMLGLEYQHTALAVNQNLIKTQPDLVRNVLKAFVEGIHFMKTQRKEAMGILAKYLKTEDPDALSEAYESIGQALVPEKPYPTLKGIQSILREMAAKDANARSARPEQFVDLSFIKELDGSGFIDRLYKTTAVAKSTVRADAPSLAVAVTPKEKPPVAEVKNRALEVEEKTKPILKQAPAAVDRAPVTPATAQAPRSGAEEYKVKPGDTLIKLAEKFYSSGRMWTKIYEANRELVKNPDYIYIGMKLFIPVDDRAS